MSNQLIDKALKYLAGDSSWKTLATGITYRKRGGVVTLTLYKAEQSMTTSWQEFGTLPSGYIPSQTIYFTVSTITNGTNIVGRITTSGILQIRLQNSGASGTYSIEGTVSYIP